MAGLNIPGVTDKYNTSATVEKLMQIERIPLTREQNQLDEYKAQKDAWREINTSLTSLRDTTKSLYSFENPFNNKLTTSTDANAITAEATGSASLQSFKVDVIQPASSDRFLTLLAKVFLLLQEQLYPFEEFFQLQLLIYDLLRIRFEVY